MSLEEYVKDISRAPLLTCDEEIILGNQVQEMMRIFADNGIDSQISQASIDELPSTLDTQARQTIKKGLRARERMISANMRLVVAVAKKIKTNQVHMTIKDLIQEGAIGLARATEKFEPGRGYKFSTYAYWWIRQGITRASESQEKTIRVPVNIQKLAKQIKDTKTSLCLELGREPTAKELSDKIGESIRKIEKIMLMDIVVISLDAAIGDSQSSGAGGERSSLLEMMPAGCEIEEEEQRDNAAQLQLATMLISALPAHEQPLIRQKYGIGSDLLSTKEMAEMHNVSEQVIRQRQQRITGKMRFVANAFSYPE